MRLTKAPKTSDAYGRYYTDQHVANLLVSSIARRTPKLILDLGTGDGMLVKEAEKQWSKSMFVTADIDARTRSMRSEGGVSGRIRHHVVDVLSNSVDKKIGVSFGSVDIGLCNPPYVRPQWRKHFGEILEDAGLSHISPNLGSIPAEVLFLAQNLRFLRSKGKLGLILPDGIISGEKFVRLREVLTQSHRVEKVFELPRGIFRRTDAKAHILVLSKDVLPHELIQVQRVEHDGKLSQSIQVRAEDAAKRLDYSYLITQAGKNWLSRAPVLRDYTTSAKRGTYSSAERGSLNFPVFHTTDFAPLSSAVPAEFVLRASEIQSIAGVIAGKGDILIARVGRNLARKVAMVTRGYVVISDCIVALRVWPDQRERIYQYLVSAKGTEALESISHGVGARFITVDGLLGLKLE